VSRAIIFDFDGIILDSETPEFESHRRVFGECGADLSVEDWCAGVGIIKPDDYWFRILCERAPGAIEFDTFETRRRGYFREHVRWEPMRGIAELLRSLDAEGIPRAVASTASAAWVLRALDDLGLASGFRTIVTGDQVQRGKPAPDVYLEAARRLAVPPANCVAVEDSGPGIAAARAAGMRVVAIPHALSAAHDFDAADLRVTHAGELTVERLCALLA
jgi:HAD superfamily hydrolase (TIGR01509 family)